MKGVLLLLIAVVVAVANAAQYMPKGSTKTTYPFVVGVTGDAATKGDGWDDKVGTLIKSWNPDRFIYIGDVYQTGLYSEMVENYDKAFGFMKAYTSPVIGNHEYMSDNNVGSGYFQYWNNVPEYYSYDEGGWHWVFYNSNSDKWNNTQLTWFQNDLKANKNKCTIVSAHHPVNGANGNMAYAAAMAQYGVKGYFAGHLHNYVRYKPAVPNAQNKAMVADANGFTSFTVGLGGIESKLTSLIAENDLIVLKLGSKTTAGDTKDVFGAMKLTITADKMKWEYIGYQGNVYDSGEFICAAQQPGTTGGTSAPTTTTKAPATTKSATTKAPATSAPTTKAATTKAATTKTATTKTATTKTATTKAATTKAPTTASAVCYLANNVYKAGTFQAQTGKFSMTVEASSNIAGTANSWFGISNGITTDSSQFAAMIRFYNTGILQAWSGSISQFSARTRVEYVANFQYTFTFEINVAAKLYNATVIVPGGSPVYLAYNYGFRAQATSLSAYNFKDWTTTHNVQWCSPTKLGDSSTVSVPQSVATGTNQTDDSAGVNGSDSVGLPAYDSEYVPGDATSSYDTESSAAASSEATPTDAPTEPMPTDAPTDAATTTTKTASTAAQSAAPTTVAPTNTAAAPTTVPATIQPTSSLDKIVASGATSVVAGAVAVVGLLACVF